MILTSDLRIGNWVQRIGWANQIAGIKGTDIWIKAKGAIIEYEIYDGFEPIELTDEWLKKFGFIQEYNEYDNYWYLPASDWFGIEFEEESKKWFCMLLSGKRSFADLHYVHQLQNLVYALTGEEL